MNYTSYTDTVNTLHEIIKKEMDRVESQFQVWKEICDMYFPYQAGTKQDYMKIKDWCKEEYQIKNSNPASKVWEKYIATLALKGIDVE